MPDGTEVNYDPEFGSSVSFEIHNETDIDNSDVMAALKNQHPELATLTRWTHSLQSRQQGLFMRDKYVNPRGVFNEMRVAQEAAETDDVVSGVLETTEQLAINRVVVETGDEDEDDIWRQILDDIDLESRMREMWREIFVTSNAYAAVLMGQKQGGYRVGGKSDKGTRRKKTYNNVTIPLAISILDPLQVVPVGNFMFGQERLAYIASLAQARVITDTLAGENSTDLVYQHLIEGPYQLDSNERTFLNNLTGDQMPLDRLFLLDPTRVFRVTATRPAYERFAPVRMKSVFPILDLKAQLREMDRATLLAATNFIILVKKGTDNVPAKPGEVERLASQMQAAARLPIIIGDHRIEIEIITPKVDHTLQPERYNSLDLRLTARLYQIMNAGNYCLTPDTEILTKTGWKNKDDLQVGELVYSPNTETGLAEWVPVERINVFQHNGPMLSLESRGHSSMSTPNHRWWVKTPYGVERIPTMKWKTSEDLGLADCIPNSSELVASGFPQEAKFTDELVELAAWFWTEGHRKREAPNRIEISQSESANPGHCERIRRLLEKVFGPEGRVSEGGAWHQASDMMKFYVSASATAPLLDLFEHEHQPLSERETVPKRPLLSFIYSLTHEQMELFVATCIDGDGTIEESGRRRWFQKDKVSVDILELCLVMLGIPCRHRYDPKRDLFVLELLTRDYSAPVLTAYTSNRREGTENHALNEWVHYEGEVWCPTTKNGTWFARRNGISFVTGNSAGSANDDSVKLIKVVARSMEARRNIIRNAVMKYIILPTYRANDQLLNEPKLKFYPSRINMDFDPNIALYLQDARALGDISRHTSLSELDINEADEAVWLEREKKIDDLFVPPSIKYAKPAAGPSGSPEGSPPPPPAPAPPVNTKGAGRRGGGNSNGGGTNKDSVRTGPPRGPGKPENSK